jgi:hypothetical protein
LKDAKPLTGSLKKPGGPKKEKHVHFAGSSGAPQKQKKPKGGKKTGKEATGDTKTNAEGPKTGATEEESRHADTGVDNAVTNASTPAAGATSAHREKKNAANKPYKTPDKTEDAAPKSVKDGKNKSRVANEALETATLAPDEATSSHTTEDKHEPRTKPSGKKGKPADALKPAEEVDRTFGVTNSANGASTGGQEASKPGPGDDKTQDAAPRAAEEGGENRGRVDRSGGGDTTTGAPRQAPPVDVFELEEPLGLDRLFSEAPCTPRNVRRCPVPVGNPRGPLPPGEERRRSLAQSILPFPHWLVRGRARRVLHFDNPGPVPPALHPPFDDFQLPPNLGDGSLYFQYMRAVAAHRREQSRLVSVPEDGGGDRRDPRPATSRGRALVVIPENVGDAAVPVVPAHQQAPRAGSPAEPPFAAVPVLPNGEAQLQVAAAVNQQGAAAAPVPPVNGEAAQVQAAAVNHQAAARAAGILVDANRAPGEVNES